MCDYRESETDFYPFADTIPAKVTDVYGRKDIGYDYVSYRIRSQIPDSLFDRWTCLHFRVYKFSPYGCMEIENLSLALKIVDMGPCGFILVTNKFLVLITSTFTFVKPSILVHLLLYFIFCQKRVSITHVISFYNICITCRY